MEKIIEIDTSNPDETIKSLSETVLEFGMKSFMVLNDDTLLSLGNLPRFCDFYTPSLTVKSVGEGYRGVFLAVRMFSDNTLKHNTVKFVDVWKI